MGFMMAAAALQTQKAEEHVSSPIEPKHIMTICAECKHLKKPLLTRILLLGAMSDSFWLCKATPTKPSCITGSGDGEYEICWAVNYGDCPKFEQK